MQRADHARADGQSDAGGTSGEARGRVASAWRESSDVLFPAGLARPRQTRRARTTRLPARQPAGNHQRGRLVRIECGTRGGFHTSCLSYPVPLPSWGGVRFPNYSISFSASITSSVCPFTFTFGNPRRTMPALSMMNVVRSMPINSRPYSDFILYTPYSLHTLLPGSASSGKFSSCLAMNLPCESVESALMPTTFAPSFLIGAILSRKLHASIVHPGVMSLG